MATLRASHDPRPGAAQYEAQRPIVVRSTSQKFRMTVEEALQVWADLRDAINAAQGRQQALSLGTGHAAAAHNALVSLLQSADDTGCDGGLIVVHKDALRALTDLMCEEGSPAWLKEGR